MSKPQGLVDVVKAPKMLMCVCGMTVFTNIIDPDGVLATCQACNKQYRLQSIGGLAIKNA